MSLALPAVFTLWLHLLAVTAWVGSILFFLFVFGPAVHTLPTASAIQVLDKGRRLFQSVSWIAIHLALLTGILGLFLRGTAPTVLFVTAYQWMFALKLLLFFAMVLHHSLQSRKYGPQLATLIVQSALDAQEWPEPLLSHWKKWFLLLKINAFLGLVVLLLGITLSRS
jgi:uncharacterized membrane protein